MFNLLRNRGHFTTAVVKRLNLLGNRGHFMTAVVKRKNSLETAVILWPPLSRDCNFLFLYNFSLFIFSIKFLLKYVYSLCPVLFCALGGLILSRAEKYMLLNKCMPIVSHHGCLHRSTHDLTRFPIKK